MTLAPKSPKNQPPVPPEGRQPPVLAAILGIVSGFLLIGIALGCPSSLNNYRWPMMAVGLSAILGALGGVAVAKYKEITAGGVAAVVLLVVTIFKPAASTPFLFGYIHGPESLDSVVVDTGVRILTGRPNQGGAFQFFAFEADLQESKFYIQGTNRAGVLPAQIIIGCIPIEILRSYVGKNVGIEFSLSPDPNDAEKQRWLLRGDDSKPIGEFGSPACPFAGPSIHSAGLVHPFRLGLGALLAPSAFAQDSVLPHVLIAELNDPALDTQTQAQDTIASLKSADEISSLVRTWDPASAPNVDPRLIVAFVQAIRGNRSVAADIASTISEPQLQAILGLTDNSDSVVRSNSTELLSWLVQATQWPSAPPAKQVELIEKTTTSAINELSQPGNLNSQPPARVVYNTLIAMKYACGALQKPLSGPVQSAVEVFSRSSRANTPPLARSRAIAGEILTSC